MTTEALSQQQIRLEAARLGATLWRNNSGAAQDKTGRLIRYGLGNDSARINAAFKSSDLIGLVPRFVTPDMLGTVVGVFVAVECKEPSWRRSYGDGEKAEREAAQERFISLVSSNGGLAGFATGVPDLRRIFGVKE